MNRSVRVCFLAMAMSLFQDISPTFAQGNLADPLPAAVSDYPAVITGSSVTITLPLKRGADRKVKVDGANDKFDATSFWLHVRGKSTCAYIKDKHEYETFVTMTRDQNSTRVPVDRLVLYFQIAGDVGQEICVNKEVCGKTIDEFNLYCRTPRCAAGTAVSGGVQWSTSRVCW